MELFKRPVAPYVVPLDDNELRGYHHLRVTSSAAATALEA
jgi:hypothetical protein